MKIYIATSPNQSERALNLAERLRAEGHSVDLDPGVSQDDKRPALAWCDVVLLLLPCDASTQADWAYAVGLGKQTCIIGEPGGDDPHPAHRWVDLVVAVDTDAEAATWVTARASGKRFPDAAQEGGVDEINDAEWAHLEQLFEEELEALRRQTAVGGEALRWAEGIKAATQAHPGRTSGNAGHAKATDCGPSHLDDTLDLLATVAAHWSRNRERGHTFPGLRQALLMLADKVVAKNAGAAER